MRKKILFFMLLSMANFSYCETKINQVEKNLHKVIEKFDMDVASEKTYAKSKQKEALIRQKELELKRAVDEYNKNMKKNTKAKKLQKRMTRKSGFGSMLASFEEIEEQKNELKNLRSDLNKLVEVVTTLKKDMEIIKRDRAEGYVSDKAKRKKVSSKMKEQFNDALKILDTSPDEAVDYFENFAKRYENHSMGIDAHLKIAEAYIKMGKWELSIKTLQNIMTIEEISSMQKAEALLLLADSQRNQNDRTSACRSLADLERSNLQLTPQQNKRYQKLIVDSDCASKLDKDIKKEEEDKQKGSILG